MKTYTVNGDQDDIRIERSDGLATTERMFRISGEDIVCSDGYHTFGELYDHRITLFIALCKSIDSVAKVDLECGKPVICPVWRSKRHSDGELCFGTGTQYVLGIGKEKGKQITYHLPIERWDETDFAEMLEQAPEWDGHTSADVLKRLQAL